MLRRYVDCRTVPSEKHCTVEISADSDDEVLEVAILHAVRDHGHEDTPELRREIKNAIKTREEALA